MAGKKKSGRTKTKKNKRPKKPSVRKRTKKIVKKRSPKIKPLTEAQKRQFAAGRFFWKGGKMYKENPGYGIELVYEP